MSGRNRFIPDEILIEGQTIKTTGALLTGGQSAAAPGVRIAQHLSERALNAEDNYDTLSPNQKTSGRTGLCPEETTKISILSGRNRFIQDEIQIVDDKDKDHRTAASNHAAHVHAYTQKSPASFHWSDSSKNGGYLLSHLVGQYHRR